MILGMTGYGRGEATAEGLSAVADVRTVNHRHLDVEIHGALLPAALEDRLRKLVASRLARGKVDIHLSLDVSNPASSSLRVNRQLVRDYVSALREIGAELGLAGQPSLDHLTQLPWNRVFDQGEAPLSPEQQEVAARALESALEGVQLMRRREGEALGADILSRIATLAGHVAALGAENEGAPAAHAAKLRERLRELATEIPLDEGRLAQEAALLADRGDIAEELTRLGSHLRHLEELVRQQGAAGKRLDFTLQETLREVNTLGAKSRGLALATRVIEMKSELERMREQAANVE